MSRLRSEVQIAGAIPGVDNGDFGADRGAGGVNLWPGPPTAWS
jgi:hypothetical protein